MADFNWKFTQPIDQANIDRVIAQDLAGIYPFSGVGAGDHLITAACPNGHAALGTDSVALAAAGLKAMGVSYNTSNNGPATSFSAAVKGLLNR